MEPPARSSGGLAADAQGVGEVCGAIQEEGQGGLHQAEWVQSGGSWEGSQGGGQMALDGVHPVEMEGWLHRAGWLQSGGSQGGSQVVLDVVLLVGADLYTDTLPVSSAD